MIPIGVQKNFETLQRAFKQQNVCCVETTRVSNGQSVYLICAVNNHGVEGVDLVPFAEMCSVDPYEAYHHPVYAMEKEEHVQDLDIDTE